MLRYAIVIVQFWLVSTLSAADITFVQSPSTGRHVALQPRTGHHRIHFVARFTNGKDQRVFARIRAANAANEELHAASRTTTTQKEFNLTSNNEAWEFYLRVPRYGNKSATYQIEIGTINPSEIDSHLVTSSFAWVVKRDANGRGTMEASPGMPIPVRRAVVEGGSVRVVSEVRVGSVDSQIKYGIDSSNVLIEGDVAKKWN